MCGDAMDRRNISLANNFLYGADFGLWIRLLAENGFRVHPRYWHRALAVTGTSLVNSVLKRIESRAYGEAVEAAPPGPPPLFVLGHWRNGTTHLQYLLAKDASLFTFPTTFQAFGPHAFLLTEKRLGPLLAPLLPKKRPMDDMALSVGSPAEDEFALALATGFSPYIGVSFPRNRRNYARYLTFAGVERPDVEAWQAAFRAFVKKLAYRAPGRHPVLKSPAHTCRIPLLQETFPGARYVHIQRDPYEVFLSSRHIIATLFPYMFLQRPDLEEVDEDILQRYVEVNDAYLAHRKLIPPGDLHEMRYEDLVADPQGELEKLYAALRYPGWERARPIFAAYLAGLSGYRRNAFRPLDPETRGLVRNRWGKYFDAFGYPA